MLQRLHPTIRHHRTYSYYDYRWHHCQRDPLEVAFPLPELYILGVSA